MDLFFKFTLTKDFTLHLFSFFEGIVFFCLSINSYLLNGDAKMNRRNLNIQNGTKKSETLKKCCSIKKLKRKKESL